ncbi:hypothetical protein [Stenotrophomonas sp. PS02289]|uniref:hypothetical protein n=1 Tax=Stenotrophomonas sp. PS02289 TaxID=2991422 RepID=UPI00249BE704|nr:hypothetical protein [Stenotrophomonas sp. PS02289]
MHFNRFDPYNRAVSTSMLHWNIPRSLVVGGLQYVYQGNTGLMVPWLDLRGMWMQRAEFDEGRRIYLGVNPGTILLSTDKEAVRTMARLRRWW